MFFLLPLTLTPRVALCYSDTAATVPHRCSVVTLQYCYCATAPPLQYRAHYNVMSSDIVTLPTTDAEALK
jgi:hypothetical protein